MDQAVANVLTEWRPRGIVASGNWRSRRSAETRLVILKATIECLNRFGYAGTTTPVIAELAAVSRGAMMHHYSTKLDLIEAVIDYIFFLRLEMFHSAERLSEDQRKVEHTAVEILWGTMLTREYEAYFQLCAAARTDEELRVVLIPRMRRYEDVIRSETFRIFPEWQGREVELQIAWDINRATLEGLLFNQALWADHERRAETVRRVIRQTLGLLRDGTLSTNANDSRAGPQIDKKA